MNKREIENFVKEHKKTLIYAGIGAAVGMVVLGVTGKKYSNDPKPIKDLMEVCKKADSGHVGTYNYCYRVSDLGRYGLDIADKAGIKSDDWVTGILVSVKHDS